MERQGVSIDHFHPSSATAVFVYCDGACMQLYGGLAAGYGVYVNSKTCRVLISEPLASEVQTSQKAEVKALSSALEVVWACRPRHALIISDSEYVVKGYNNWMMAWKQNNWTKESGGAVSHSDIWNVIHGYAEKFQVRKMNVEVHWKERNTTPGQKMADQLAKQGCKLNFFCDLCETYIGREGTEHECHPVCNQGQCEDRRFANLKAFQQHVDNCHSIIAPCRKDGCGMVFGSEAAAASHEWMVHRDFVFDCRFCYDVFDDDDTRQEHEREECPHSPYCDYCDRWFVHTGARDQHRRDYHGWW